MVSQCYQFHSSLQVYGLAADLIKVLDEDGDNQLKDEEFVKYYKDHMERMSSGNQVSETLTASLIRLMGGP